MKRRIILLVVVMAVLIPPTLGDGLPFTESIVIERFGNQYSKLWTLPVYVQEGSSIEIENRTIETNIGPEIFMRQEDGTSLLESRELFLKVLVSIAWGDTDFESYLNCRCGEHGGQLFWDHAGEDRADEAGEPFLPHPPLIVEDEYFKVTLRLIDLEISSEKCGVNHPQYLNCDSDYDCLFYMDSLTLTLTVDYSPAQENLKSQYETGLEPEPTPAPEPSELEQAVEHETKAADFFDNKEYQKAITEYQQARAIYDRLDKNKKVREIQKQIDLCNSYITAENDLEKGIKLFQEAERIEGEGNLEDAREKYKEARGKFETAKNEFERVDDQIQIINCQTQFDECNNRIGNIDARIKAEATKTYLTIGAIAVAVVGAGGVAIRHRKKKYQDVTIQKEKVSEPQNLEETELKPQVLTCPLCKNEIQENWALCPYCGVRLKEDTQIY